MFIKLNELRYLAYIFPMVENQLLKYSEAMPDVMNYVLATLNSTSSVEPPANARSNILYYQLYEELKTLLQTVIFSQIKLLCFQPDNCVFFIYILYTFLPLECAPVALYTIHIPTTRIRAPLALYYIRHPCVYALYFDLAAWKSDHIHARNAPVLI